MKINSIKNDITLNSGFLETRKNSQSEKKKNAGLCEKNNRGYNVAFNGSLPVKSEAAVNAMVSGKMRLLNWLLDFVKEHNVAGSALMSLFLAGALRPATIMALPGEKDKEDKIYASGHSMASGLIGFAVSTALTTPWDGGVKKVMENYKEHYDVVINNLKNGESKEPPKLKYNFSILKNKYEKLVELEKEAATSGSKLAKKACKQYIDTLALEMKNITDWAIAIPRSMLTIALIPPILKYVFGLEKKKSGQKTEAQNPSANTLPVANLKQNMEALMQKSFSDFNGGKN